MRRSRLKGGVVEWMGVDVNGVWMSGEKARDRVCVERAWGGCGWMWLWRWVGWAGTALEWTR